MKKLLIAAAAAGLVGTANAQSAFEGFFGQIGIGYESIDPKFSNGTITGASATGQAYTISGSSSNSFTGNVAVGSYFSITKEFLLGIGAEYSPIAGSSANATFSIPAYSYSEVFSYKKKNSYNIFLSPAYAIDKTKLAYAKVGYTGLSTETTNPDGTKDTTNYSGYSLGLGYKQIIDGGLYGFAEANYASYGSKPLADLSGSTKPTSMNFLVGVGYKF
jgi:outer membrane immunogenic protein